MEDRKDGGGVFKGSGIIFLLYDAYSFSPPNVYFEDFPCLGVGRERKRRERGDSKWV